MLSDLSLPSWRDWRLPFAQAAASVAVGLMLGLLSVRFSPGWVAFGLGGIAGMLIVMRRPDWGLLAIFFVISVVDTSRLPLLSMGPISLHLTDLALLFLLGLIVLRALALPGFRLVSTRIDLLVLWFYGAVILAAFVAIVGYDVPPNFVMRRLRPLTYYLGFFVVTNLIREKRQLDTLIRGMILMASFAALAVAIQIVFPSLKLVTANQAELSTAGRYYSGVVRTFIEADRLIYLMFIFLMSSLAVGARWLSPPLTLAGIALLALGVFFSFQRNYWLSTASMLVLLALLVSWHMRLRYLRWAALGVLLLLIVSQLSGKLGERYTNAALERLEWGMRPSTLAQDGSTQKRIEETEYAWRSIQQHPLFGIGLANIYRPLTEDDLNDDAYYLNYGLRWYIHNGYLWILVQTGLVGFVPFILMYSVTVWRGLHGWRKAHDPQQQALLLGLSLALLGQMISNLVSPNFIQSWSLLTYAVALGLIERTLNDAWWEKP